MTFFRNTLGLLLASLALASCGGGGSNGGAYSPPQSGSITLSARNTTLPLNVQGLLPHDHGSNQTEITITMRNADGSLMVGHDVSVSISPVEVAALSFLVQEGNDDFDQLWGTFTIKGTNGIATAWVNAGAVAGTAILTASTTDPTTSRSISATLSFKVTAGVGPAPASVTMVPTPAGVYLPSSGGINTSRISATVLDGGAQFVPDPVTGNNGVDNIQFEIVGEAGDARLSSNSVAGAVSGTTVLSHTVQGVATASFQAGENTPQGPIQIRATVDRADNNVSNGIQDPVSSTTSVIVSDGKLYSLELTSPLFAPALPGLTINSVSDQVDTSDIGTIPANPDATLTLTMSALAKDRQGNPVIPGTAIRFGLVDAPVGAPGAENDNQFLLSGVDGDPQEGGTLFTAPGGHFTSAGGGAGAGDALVVFGKAVQGNTDLESAVTVQRVNSATSLSVLPGFNLNNTTGNSVDSGPVLPYLIGRAEHGSITAQATTNDLGVAHAKLTYTVNTVFNSVAVWAQGDGVDRVSGNARRVTDAGTMAYPAVAPATILASPNPLAGNSTQNVTVCVADALGIRLRGVQIRYRFTLPSGTGSIEPNDGGNSFKNLTGLDGCVTGQVKTTGLPVTAAGGNSGQIVFTGAGATSEPIDLVVQLAFLSVAPPQVCAAAAPGSAVVVTAHSTGGGAVSGVALTGSCTGTGITLDTTSGTTDASGSALFHVIGDSTNTGQCVFASTDTASQSVTVSVRPDTVSPPGCG